MEEKSKTEESFTPEEQRVIAAARDLAALVSAFGNPGLSRTTGRRLNALVDKAGRVLEQSVAALLAVEQEAP